MKIAVISTSSIPSTTANSIQVMKVCQAYAQLGADVALFVPGTDEYTWQEMAGKYGLRIPFQITWIHSSRKFHRYDFSLQAIRHAKKWHADIVHTWSAQVAFLLNFIKIPYLLELHEMPSGKIGPYLYRQIFRSKTKKRFLPITNALWNKLDKEYSLSGKHPDMVISPDGVDFERYQSLPSTSAARMQLGLTDCWSAVYTGHLYSGRGMQLLLDLANALPEIQFVWVGGNPTDVEVWKRRILEQHVGNIFLTGFIKNDEIPLYQAAGDILLMPYEKSIKGSGGGNTVDICSPMKMFEYMAAGRPIISSELPVLREVLNDENAIFCEVENISAWINAIRMVQEEPQRIESLAKQAKLDARQYTWMKRCENGLRGFLNE